MSRCRYFNLTVCREYNGLVKSCKKEVEDMKMVQATSMQEQQRLDEESLQRIKAAEEAKKVGSFANSSPPMVIQTVSFSCYLSVRCLVRTFLC